MYYLPFEDLITKAKENLNNLTDEEKIGYEKCISDFEKMVDDAEKNHEFKHQFQWSKLT